MKIRKLCEKIVVAKVDIYFVNISFPTGTHRRLQDTKQLSP